MDISLTVFQGYFFGSLAIGAVAGTLPFILFRESYLTNKVGALMLSLFVCGSIGACIGMADLRLAKDAKQKIEHKERRVQHEADYAQAQLKAKQHKLKFLQTLPEKWNSFFLLMEASTDMKELVMDAFVKSNPPRIDIKMFEKLRYFLGLELEILYEFVIVSFDSDASQILRNKEKRRELDNVLTKGNIS